MIFGKHINVYYRKYALALLTGLLALFTVDYLQLKVPEIYQLVNGLNQGYIVENGVQVPFDGVPAGQDAHAIVGMSLAVIFGGEFPGDNVFGAAIKVETDLRNDMFDHAKDLSVQYYQVNKVGNLMSLFTNDLETVQDCYGSGFLLFFDALVLFVLSVYKMWRMNHLLTGPVPYPHGHCCSEPHGGWQLPHQKVGLPSGGLLQSVRLLSGELLRHCRHQGLCEGGQRIAGLLEAERENEVSNVEFTKATVLLRILVELFVEAWSAVILGYGGYLVCKRGAFAPAN